MFPGAAHLASELNEQLRIAHRGQKAEALHNLAEQVRFRYGIVPPEGAEAHALLRSVRTIWDDRDLLFDRKSSPAGTVAALDDQFRGDLLELIATWAELRTRLAGPAGTGPPGTKALRILEEARSDYGPSFTIDRLRRSLAADLGRVESLPHVEAVPRSAYDHYDLGRSLLRAEQFQAAAEQFQRGLERRPQDFWPNFYLGLCEYRLKHYQEAMTAFRAATALAPTRAECDFNRGMAADALGRRDLAIRDYTLALEKDPD